jgi:hypothetical protein
MRDGFLIRRVNFRMELLNKFLIRLADKLGCVNISNRHIIVSMFVFYQSIYRYSILPLVENI